MAKSRPAVQVGLHDYELPGYEDGYTEAQSEPPFHRPEHAMGSVEFEAEILQILTARQAAKERRERTRLARVAAFLGNKV